VGDLSASLASHFGITGAKAVKERGCYFYETANGFYKIHKTSNTPREINARYKLLKQLDEKGFTQTDLIIPTANGVPHVSLGRDVFVMTRHVSGQEPDFNNPHHMELIMKSLASFHTAAQNIKSEIHDVLPLTEVFAKQEHTLRSAVKKVNRQPRLSDFDVLMLKHAEAYAEKMTAAMETLNATHYAALHAEAIKNNHICHNDLKEESLTINDEACHISRFEEATTDLQLNDLASILRRYARKSNREISIETHLENYNKIAPLPASAEKILHAMLSFPWPFIKIVTSFYSKKRNFTPAAITSRMADVLKEQEQYDAYTSQGASLG
jgi:CotS family spore coat protein